jgi:plastocyanin
LPAQSSTASARRSSRAGAVLLHGTFVAAAVLAVASCDRVGVGTGDEGPRVIELAHDTIRLEAGVRLVEVRVRRDAQGDFDPAHAEARTGDYVRFTAADRGGHAIGFAAGMLEPAVHEFLQRTNQMRSPPLITDGASWVLTLADAPPGEYPFHCTTHDAPGRLTVSPR